MRYGYIRANRWNSIVDFQKEAKLENVPYYDLPNALTSTNLYKLKKELKSGDTLVIPSLENFCIKSECLKDLANISDFLREGGISLECLKSTDASVILTINGLEALRVIRDLVYTWEHTEAKMGRPLKCPENFLEVYAEYRLKDKDKKINSKEAAKRLGIGETTFYTLVREFER